VHIALLGDPSLRMTMVRPPSNVVAVPLINTATITWSVSNDATHGYHVYRYDNVSQSWVRRTASPVTLPTYIDDITGQSGIVRYMVKALKLETTPSGSYYNLSLGAFGQMNVGGLTPDCLGVIGGQRWQRMHHRGYMEHLLPMRWRYGRVQRWQPVHERCLRERRMRFHAATRLGW
jgi:hypothetical protein